MSKENLGKVLVTKVMQAREGNNQDYLVIQAKQIIERKDRDSFISMFLKGNNKETKVALQNIHKDVIAEMDIKEGSDLSEAFGVQMKIKVTEVTKSELDAMNDSDKLGFQIKRNPETQEELATPDGEPIYRKQEIRPDVEGEEDVRVQHVRVPRAAGNPQAGIEAVKEEDLTA